MCILEEFGVFPGLLHTKSERCTDWHNTSNKTLESKGDRTRHAALSNVISHAGLVHGTSPHLHPCVSSDDFPWGEEEKNLSNILSPAQPLKDGLAFLG